MSEMFVSPDEVAIPVVGKVNLLEAMINAGLDVAHLCGARARCSTCRVRVVEGPEALTERTDEEAEMATRLSFPDEVRLACQTEVNGSVRLWRLVLDKLDAEMASQLGEGHYRGSVGREVEEAAVMFTDVVGFTTMSESLPPYDVVHILNRFFSRVGTAIESRGGRVDNYMGDGLLAVFGVDNETDSALAAVRAGLEALEVAADMDNYVVRIYGHAFRVRVGISLGEVIFGMMGGESSARETVIGDVVNTASRLESANKTTGTTILVTDAVRDKTIADIAYGRRFDLELPGKDGQVVAHEPVGLINGSEVGVEVPVVHRGGSHCELLRIQPRIQPIAPDQLLVGSLVHDLPLGKHNQPIGCDHTSVAGRVQRRSERRFVEQTSLPC